MWKRLSDFADIIKVPNQLILRKSTGKLSWVGLILSDKNTTKKDGPFGGQTL
jgi:hypothetical protein